MDRSDITQLSTVRHKMLIVNLQTILHFLEEGETHFRSTGLPIGSKFVRFGHDYMGQLFVIVEHESFPEIKHGDKYPELNVRLEKLGV